MNVRLLCMDEDMVFAQGNVVHDTQITPLGNGGECCALFFYETSPRLRFKVPLLGFTLIELLVTLLVFAIILTLIVPSLQTLIQNNRLTANRDTLISSLNYARSVALNQGVNVRVCPLGSPGSTTCGNNWNSGWIVVTQPATGTATLLNSHQASTNDPNVNANVSSVIFDPHGLSTTQSNFSVCDSRGSSHALSAMVLATGFVQSGQTSGVAVWNSGSISCP